MFKSKHSTVAFEKASFLVCFPQLVEILTADLGIQKVEFREVSSVAIVSFRKHRTTPETPSLLYVKLASG